MFVFVRPGTRFFFSLLHIIECTDHTASAYSQEATALLFRLSSPRTSVLDILLGSMCMNRSSQNHLAQTIVLASLETKIQYLKFSLEIRMGGALARKRKLMQSE